MSTDITTVELPSGATLRIQLSPFAQSKALYQAVLRELRGVAISSAADVTSIFKDAFCIGFASPAIETALNECMKRCTIDYGKGPMRIDADTFEPVEARDDYMKVCIEVVKANIFPFGKSLYSEFRQITAMIENIPRSKSQTTT